MTSWIDRAIAHRQYFESTGSRTGTRHVFRWICMFGGATAEWATRVVRELDDAMATGGHDGDAAWGRLRNDVTTWLAAWVRDYARVDDRTHLVAIAACTERYLRALGAAHAAATAPLAARWRDALERADVTTLDAFLDDARATAELHTLGAAGVLPLMEASARTIDGAAVRMSSTPDAPASVRSGQPLSAPILVRIWPRDGGEHTKRFDTVERLAIGRADTADIWLDDGLVNREHARIVRDADTIVVEDLRSDNRTFIFETPIDRAALYHRDVLIVGGNLLVVESCES